MNRTTTIIIINPYNKTSFNMVVPVCPNCKHSICPFCKDWCDTLISSDIGMCECDCFQYIDFNNTNSLLATINNEFN